MQYEYKVCFQAQVDIAEVDCAAKKYVWRNNAERYQCKMDFLMSKANIKLNVKQKN